MKEGGAASQVSDDEERFFNRLCFMPGKEDVIQQKKEPVHELPKGPDQIEDCQKDDSFSGETGGSIFCAEEGSVEGTPE